MNNSASRLLALVNALSTGDAKVRALDHWIRVLQLEGDHAHDEAVAGMQAALAELRQLESQLQRLNVPPALYSKAMTALRQTFSPLRGDVPWAQASQDVERRPVRYMLEWCAYVTEGLAEPDMEGPALEALLASIEAQEKILADGGLTPEIQSILLQSTTELRRALRLSTISGAAPLRKAFDQSVTSLLSVDKETAQKMTPADQEAVDSGVDVLRRAAAIAKSGTELLDFFTRVHTTASGLLGFGQNLLTQQ